MCSTTNVAKLLNRVLETKSEEIKLGIDQHAASLTVCVQLEGSRPLRPVKLSSRELLWMVGKLVAASCRVFCCYEAGPCGYGLHRQLVEAGAKNLVVVPKLLCDGRKQKTDKLDSAGLVEELDRYLKGHTKAFSVVNVPSVEEEDQREEARLREQLKKSRQQWEARGRSLLLFKGHQVSGCWWGLKRWGLLKPTLSAFLIQELEVMRTMIVELDAQEKARRKQLEASAPKELPKAIGALTWVLLAREIRNWTRFGNRRAVSSYTGLCPGVYQTGARRREGCINRCGNPRVRAMLIELVWRLARYQPDYPPVRALVAGVARGAARRKCAVAAARRLAVDLWRLATGQTTPEKLKLIVPAVLA